jgi:hypothetical protein
MGWNTMAKRRACRGAVVTLGSPDSPANAGCDTAGMSCRGSLSIFVKRTERESQKISHRRGQMIRSTGVAFLLAFVSLLVSCNDSVSKGASEDDEILKLMQSISESIRSLAGKPPIDSPEMDAIFDRFKEMTDASLYVLKSAPDACATKLVKFDCQGLPSAEIKPLVELVLDKRRADAIDKVAKRSSELANNNFRISMASLSLSGLSFGVALFGAVIKKREYDAARRKAEADANKPAAPSGDVSG